MPQHGRRPRHRPGRQCYGKRAVRPWRRHTPRDDRALFTLHWWGASSPWRPTWRIWAPSFGRLTAPGLCWAPRPGASGAPLLAPGRVGKMVGVRDPRAHRRSPPRDGRGGCRSACGRASPSPSPSPGSWSRSACRSSPIRWPAASCSSSATPPPAARPSTTPGSSRTACAINQPQHAARALELHQRGPVVVEPVEDFGWIGYAALIRFS